MYRVLAMCSALLGVVARVAGAEPETLTLRDAVREALRASPALSAPDDGRTLAALRERQADAKFGVQVIPQLQTASSAANPNQRSVGVGVSKQLPFGTTARVDANRYEFGDGSTRFQDTGYTVSLSQPLLRGWTEVTSADRIAARRGSASAARSYADARQRLVVSVADAYFSVVRASRLLEIAGRAAERAERLRISSEARAKIGLATQLDVLRAELLASQAEADLVDHRERREAANDALNTLIGRDIGREVEIEMESINNPAAPPDRPLEHFIQTALAARTDVLEARDKTADARRSQRMAQWNLLPPVTLDVSYVKRGLGSPEAALFGQLFNGWHVGVSTAYSIDRSDQQAAAGVAAVSVRAAEREAADTERKVTDEVRSAYRDWQRTSALIDLQKKAVDLAERQLRLAQLRYQTGVAGNFDVVDAENSLLQAQSALVAAQTQRALAALVLNRVSGTLDPDSYAQ